jgi:predicted nuclease with TOPRIM domain
MLIVYLTFFEQREELYSNMREVIVRLNNVSTHPDLNIFDHLKGAESDLAKEASWAEYSSAKFLFLGNLIELVGTNELHLIIAVGNEEKQKVLERYLQGKGFVYTKPREEMGSAIEVSLAKGSLSFGIHSSESARELFKPPAAIFALDSSFSSKSPSMQHIRTTYARSGNLLPVIWFFVANTAEHIERCLPDTPEPERLHLLVHYIARFHDEVGDLQDDALGVHEDAEEILNYLLDGVIGWPLPTIEPLNLVSIEELEVANDSSSDDVPTQAAKRALDDDHDDYSSKRARVDNQENSQLTESTKPPSQTLDRDLQSLEENLVQMKAIHAAEKEELQAKLAQANSRWSELEKALGTLQHRYESRTNELHKVRQERDRLAENQISIKERAEKNINTIAKLKEEREQLEGQLEEVRKAIKDGGGSPAEIETLREEIRHLGENNSILEHKAKYHENQAEYLRDRYQEASTTAAQSGTENRRLTIENEELKRQAEGNMIRLHEINTQDTSSRHVARIEELEITLASRDEFLRKKEDELREIRKNRPSTRSTSTQPRSPKWTGSRPTSPGVGHNGNGNGNGGIPGRASALRYSSEMRF